MRVKQKILYSFRHLLKHTLNPLTRRLARSGRGPFAIVQHVGRRSGKRYETPIIIARSGGDIVIELTYGPEVDWYQNVLAAGGLHDPLSWQALRDRQDRTDEYRCGQKGIPPPGPAHPALDRTKTFCKIRRTTLERMDE